MGERERERNVDDGEKSTKSSPVFSISDGNGPKDRLYYCIVSGRLHQRERDGGGERERGRE